MRKRSWLLASLSFAIAACSVSASPDVPADGNGGAAPNGTSDPGPGSAGDASSISPPPSAAGDASDDNAQGTSPGGGAAPLATLGTLVVLGDSIGDGGGQAPFYYDLLRQDLSAKYGSILYKHGAQSGSKTSALAGQIDALPASLPGPVAVTITSGGNDMKASLGAIMLGMDAAPRAQMGQSVKAALDKLLAPGRFGPGVLVYVYEGDIYDASDGHGDFGSHSCAFGQGTPTTPTDTHFADWNASIVAEVTAHGQTHAAMHDLFYGHGYHASPDWYASDCTHPSSLGHDQLRRIFYKAITGSTLP